MNYFELLFQSLPGLTNYGLIYGLLGIGVFITFKILDFADLTVDGSFALGGAVFVALWTAGIPMFLALLIAVAAGAVAGLLTAVFHCYFGIPGILAGILTQLILYSVNLLILKGSFLGLPQRGGLLSSLSEETSMLIIAGICAAVIGFIYWFFGTRYGSSIRATGSNEAMSRANGINVNSRKITALMISNAIVALSGALFSKYFGTADVGHGTGKIVIALAAIIIGLAICKKFGRNFAVQLVFVAIGGFIYSFIYQAIYLVLDKADLLKMISAVIVAIFLGIPYFKSHYLEQWIAKRNRMKGGN